MFVSIFFLPRYFCVLFFFSQSFVSLIYSLNFCHLKILIQFYFVQNVFLKFLFPSIYSNFFFPHFWYPESFEKNIESNFCTKRGLWDSQVGTTSVHACRIVARGKQEWGCGIICTQLITLSENRPYNNLFTGDSNLAGPLLLPVCDELSTSVGSPYSLAFISSFQFLFLPPLLFAISSYLPFLSYFPCSVFLIFSALPFCLFGF